MTLPASGQDKAAAATSSTTPPPASSLLPEQIVFIERNWLSANGILMFDGAAATLVDTGYGKHAELSVAVVEKLLAARGAHLQRVLNTHLHSDHCGGNAAFAQRFGARVLVPQASLDDVARWDEEALSYAATAQHCPRFVADEGVSAGATLTMGNLTWQALAAPGHDPRSLILYSDESGILISADALWRDGFGVLFSELQGEDGLQGQEDVLDSIERLSPRVVLPGHGPAFTEVADALARARRLLQRMRADPRRVATHTLKVLVSYRMMDLEREERARCVTQLAAASVPRAAAERLGQSAEQAVEAAIDELLARGVLIADGPWLHQVA